MSDAIQVSLTPDTLQALPAGDAVEAVVTIQNIGAAVDQYAVELDGLPTTWYTLSNTSVALFPQDKEEARLVVRPPKGSAVKAGTYPFTVTVLSRADSSQTSRVEGKLQVGAVAAFDLDMSPKKAIGRKGRYTVTMRNGGNADLDVVLEASDAEDACRYTFKPAEPHVTAGQTLTTRLTVRPRRSWLVGPKKQIDFQLRAKPGQGEAKTVQGQLVHMPRFRTWQPVRRLLILLVLLVLLVGGLYAAGGINGLGTYVSRWRITVAGFLCERTHVFCSVPPLPPIHRPGQHHPNITYIGAFGILHSHHPHLIGDPVTPEYKSGTFTLQRTTTGLLIFDTEDGHSYFVPHDSNIYELDSQGEHHLK